MGRIIISAGHGGIESGGVDPGAIAGNTTEAREMILLRDLIVTELRSRGFEVLSVPDDLSLVQTIDWVNTRGRTGDVALEIHADAYNSPSVRGASVFYIANNDQRRAHAELLLLALTRRVPQLPSRGARPDTTTGIGSLPFCRRIIWPSLLMEVGFLTNPDDRNLLQTRRRDFALGISDGLAAWSRAVAGTSPTPTTTSVPASTPSQPHTLATPTTTASPTATPAAPATVGGTAGATVVYPPISININGRLHGEQGIIINGNSYIPVDLVDSLGINLAQFPEIRRVRYSNVVYIKAVDLREFNVSVGWESATRTVVLRSILRICPGAIDRIMTNGNTSELQLMMFLKANNENALVRFPDISRLYREEASVEGVNYDIAFCQMCVETGFLRFGGDVRPEQNNFSGLGAIGAGAAGASFPSARIGIRAQVQHLKAYASTEPLIQELVDPRFRFVTRGVAPLVTQLSGRWAADPQYGEKIISTLRRLYESANLL